MIVIRLALLLCLTGIGLSLLMFLLRRDPRYLRLAWQIFKFSAVLALAFGVLLVLGRLLLSRMPF